MTRTWIAGLCLLFVSTALPASTRAENPSRRVLKIFEALARIRRPSGEEEGVRRYILGLLARLPPAKRRKIESRIDDQGNLFITLPATGKYAAAKMPLIILQSHMDMVEGARAALPGADLTPYFEKGISTMEEKGWLYSKGKATTLGADDGIGVAMALRYLVEPNVAHPPLLLMFTVCEEGTPPACAAIFKRAPEIEVPKGAPVLINLDAGAGDAFIYGSPGARSTTVSAKLPTAPQPEGQTLLKISLQNLKGGHSGNDIHRPRLNPVQGAWQLISALAAQFPELLLVRLQSGGRLSALASQAELVVSLAKTNLPRASEFSLEAMRRLVAAQADEDPARVEFRAEPIATETGPVRGLMAKEINRVATIILSLKHGISVEGSDPPYPHGFKAATNIGRIELTPDSAGQNATLTVGLAVRGFFAADFNRVVDENIEKLKRLTESPEELTVTPGNLAPPWVADTEDWFYGLIRRVLPEHRLALATGGIEPRDYAQKAPYLKMVALAPTLRDAHSPDEALEIASVGKTITVLDRLIAAVAGEKAYREWTP